MACERSRVETERKYTMTITRIAPLRTVLSVLPGLLIGGSVLASGASAAPAHRPAEGSIKSVVLTTGDVTQIYGGGVKTFINGVISNKDIASAEKTANHSSSPSMTNVGRVTGFDSVWFRGSRTSYLSVTNAVNEYRNSSILQANFGPLTNPIKRTKGVTFRLSPFSGVGDEALILTVRSHGTTALGIIFRRGRYLVNVLVSVKPGTVSLSSLSKLAAIEDQRIKAHG
jgi:hypothetical protein